MAIVRGTSGSRALGHDLAYLTQGPLNHALQLPGYNKDRLKDSILRYYERQREKREQRRAERGGGAGAGAAIGAVAGAVLAPVTFGASLAAVPALAAAGASVGGSLGGAIGGAVKPAGSPEAAARDQAMANVITGGLAPLGAGLLGGTMAKMNPRTTTVDQAVGTMVDEAGNDIGTQVQPITITEKNPFRRGFQETYQGAEHIRNTNPFVGQFIPWPQQEFIPSRRFNFQGGGY